MTDVVEAVAVTREVPPERRAEIFRAAQQVCAEELRLARTGFAPASIAELAERAVRLLPPDLGGDRVPVGGWFEDAPFPEEAPAETPASVPDDVFEAGAEGPAPWAAPPDAAPPSDEDEPGEAAEADEDEPDVPEIEFATVGRPGPPARGGRLVTVLVLAAIAGGVWFFVRTKKAPTPSPPPADTAETTAPVPAAPGSGSSEQPAAASAPAPRSPSASPAPPAASTPPAIPESRGSSIVTPDWTGRSPVWMIHFSSYQRKENADRDAARLAKLLGRPLRVVEVNLGTQGLWYRVMLGEYPSRESAQAERDTLAERGTPGIGFVYRVEGLPPSRVERLPPSRVEGVSPPRADAP